jgi:hypothetical protein
MDDATDVPLLVIECIESMKNDVKRKIGTRSHRRAMHDERDEVPSTDLALVTREHEETQRTASVQHPPLAKPAKGGAPVTKTN